MLPFRIPRVQEPVEAKRHFMLRRVSDPQGTIATIKQGTWFTTRYYNMYKEFLRSIGIKWQDLMRAYAMVSHYFVKWAMGEGSWEEALDALEKALNNIVLGRLGSVAGSP